MSEQEENQELQEGVNAEELQKNAEPSADEALEQPQDTAENAESVESEEVPEEVVGDAEEAELQAAFEAEERASEEKSKEELAAAKEQLLKQIIEALLFATQKPLSIKEVQTVLRSAADFVPDDEQVVGMAKIKASAIEKTIDQLRVEYEEDSRGYRLVQQTGGWILLSCPEYSHWVRQLYPENRPARLSSPALETLAIISYRQPITRADLEAVRGVAVDGVMQTLLDRGMVKIAGRADVPGKPLLYETTQAFLDHFGLRTLDELPNGEELRKVQLPTAESVAAEKAALVGEKPVKTLDGELPLEEQNNQNGTDSAPEQEAAAASSDEIQNPETAEEVPSASAEVNSPEQEELTPPPVEEQEHQENTDNTSAESEEVTTEDGPSEEDREDK